MRKATGALILALATQLTGCASLCDRRDFAAKAGRAAEPVLRDFRGYVDKDSTLADDEKRMRHRLADELNNYLKEGAR